MPRLQTQTNKHDKRHRKAEATKWLSVQAVITRRRGVSLHTCCPAVRTATSTSLQHLDICTAQAASSPLLTPHT